MPLKPIRTRADHDRALAEIERLMGASVGKRKPGSILPDHDLFVVTYEEVGIGAHQCPDRLLRRYGKDHSKQPANDGE